MDLSIALAVGAAAFIGWKIWSVRRSPAQLAEAARLLDQEGGVLVDVRSAAEFNAGHAPGAVNMPVGTGSSQLQTLGATDRPIVVHCASGSRSMMAIRQLKAAGFTRVVDIGTLSNAMALPRGGGPT